MNGATHKLNATKPLPMKNYALSQLKRTVKNKT